MAPRVREGGEQDLVRLYLDGIGRYPLLTKEDEVRLAQAIEAGREAADTLGLSILPPSRRRVLRRTVLAGERAVDPFTQANLRLLVSIAKRYQSADMPLLDLIQEGNLGLVHAVEKFDWRKGFKFSTYATWWIRQAIGRGIDTSARAIRLPVHAGAQMRRLLRLRAQMEGELGRTPSETELAEGMQMPESQVSALLRYGADPVSLEAPVGSDGDTRLADLVADRNTPSPFDAVADSLLSGDIDRLLATLEERERQILRLRYGLDRGEPRTLEEVGVSLCLTRERIRQIERQALAKLRHPSSENGALDLLAAG